MNKKFSKHSKVGICAAIGSVVARALFSAACRLGSAAQGRSSFKGKSGRACKDSQPDGEPTMWGCAAGDRVGRPC